MDKDELTKWALASGWQMIGTMPSLTKPSAPKEAIVRMVFKKTVVTVEVKKPAGKWEQIAGKPYREVVADPDSGLPLGLSFETIPGFSRLMEENKDRMTFDRMK